MRGGVSRLFVILELDRCCDRASQVIFEQIDPYQSPLLLREP